MNLRGIYSGRDAAQELQKVQNWARSVDRALAQVTDLKQNPAAAAPPPDIVPDPNNNFFYLPGRPGGQIGHGDINASGRLVLSSTANSTKGKIYFGSALGSAYDDYNSRLGLKTASPSATLHVKGEPPSVQVVVPNGDRINPGGATWVGNDGTGTDVYRFINDQPVDGGDAKTGYIDVTGSGPFTFDLTAVTDPGAASDASWVCKIDYEISAGSAPVNVSLCNTAGVNYGASFISPHNPTAGVRETFTYTCDGTAIAAIRSAGDFAGFCIKLSRGAGVPIKIYDVWLEAPDAGGGGGAGTGGKTAIFQAVSSQTETLSEWQNSSGTALLTATVGGRFTVESGGSFRHVPGAAASTLFKGDANGDASWGTIALLSAYHNDTTGAAPVRGDIITAQGATPLWTRLAKGAADTILQMGANEPAWVAKASAISHTLLDGSVHTDTVAQGATKGSLIVANATPKWDELVVGTDGQVLTADSAQTLGVKWATPSGGSNALLDGTNHTDTVAQTVSRGSIIYGNSTPKWDELAIGAAGKVLYSDGTDVSWGSTIAEEFGFDKSLILKGLAHEPSTPTPARPSAGYTKVFAQLDQSGSLVRPAFWGAEGRMQAIQGLLGHNGCSAIVPGTSTTPGVFNTVIGSTTTVSHPAQATTNFLTQLRRIAITTTVAANQQGTIFESRAHLHIGNAAGRGGFYVAMTGNFNIDTALGHYGFMGLYGSTAAIGNNQPSTLGNVLGIGLDAGDTNFHWFYNDAAGGATKTDTGLAWNGTRVVRLEIYCAPNGSTVYMWLTCLDDTSLTVKTINTNTNIPANTTFLSMHIHANTGADNTSPVVPNLIRAYSETDI